MNKIREMWKAVKAFFGKINYSPFNGLMISAVSGTCVLVIGNICAAIGFPTIAAVFGLLYLIFCMAMLWYVISMITSTMFDTNYFNEQRANIVK
jgi:uncharacterized membrane protein